MAKQNTNHTGRSPSPGQHRNILLALGWYYPQIHMGVARFARDHGWHITADFDDLVPKHWSGDGVLTLLGAQQDIWRRLRHLDVPIVDLAESRPNIKLPRVTMDNAAIGRMAAEHFIQRGYRHYAYVSRWDLGVSRQRGQHFKSKVIDAGHKCTMLHWQRDRAGRPGIPDTRQQRHRWLIKKLQALPKPVALFAMRDNEAVEVIEACMAADLAVPDQVAVLGVDNTEVICDCLRVPLSSIDNNLEEVGYEAAALLEKLLCGHPAPTKPCYIAPSHVVERRSTDHLAVDHPQVAKALHFIHEYAHLQISMSDVISHVAMSRSGLEKAFREHYIRAPMEELRTIRLMRVKKMLLETDDKIHVIALRTGFRTPHNLCRTFKAALGCTPKQFRNNPVR